MKTETVLVTERLAAIRSRQDELRLEIAQLDAEAERYAITLEVLGSLHGSQSPESEPSEAVDEPASLSEAILGVFREHDGLKTGDVVTSVQSVLKDAKYSSVVTVISRLVSKEALRRDGGLLYRNQ